MKLARRTRIAAVALAMFSMVGIAGCSAADTAQQNVSTAADNFEIMRRVVFYNSITDTYMFTIEGRCSITPSDGQIDVLCKIADDEFVRHSLGVSDNVTWFMEQTEVAAVDDYTFRIIFRPETLVPGIEVDTSDDN